MKLYYWVMNLIDTVRRFFFWGWTLRNSYDFDYDYLYGILEIKLIRMRECFLDSNIRDYNEKSKFIRRMTICIELIKRLREDRYYENANPKLYQEKMDHILESLKVGSTIVPKGDARSSLEMLRKSDEMEKRDRELLFKLMSKNIKYWWN